jgi:hypothetical protein
MGKQRRVDPTAKSDFPRAPRRLVQQGGALGGLFEDAEPAFRSGLSEAASWRRLEARLDRRRRWLPKRYLCAAY